MSGIPVPSAFDPVVLPGSNNRDMTDQICGLATRSKAVSLVVDRDCAVRRAHLRVARLHRLAVLAGGRHLGHRLAGDVGLRHHQLCLVDRDRQRRDFHLGAVLSDALRMAQFDQSPCRVDDIVRRCLRRHLPDPASWPTMAVLLAGAVSRDNAHLAAIPQPAAVGFLRHHDLRPVVNPVLVSWPDP